jgi:PAS domain S-box-containing protein
LEWPGPQIQFVNEAMCSISGYSKDELVGGMPHLLHKEWGDRVAWDQMASQLSAGLDVRAEVSSRRKDGSQYDCELFLTALVEFEGSGNYAILIHRDVTERKEAERALIKNKERTRAILDMAADVILTSNSHGIIESVNPAIRTMFGYEPDEVIGRHARLLTSATLSPPNAQESAIGGNLNRGCSSIAEISHNEIGRRKDGSIFPVSVTVSSAESLELRITILHDISERHELQRDVLNRAEEEQRRIGTDLHDSTQQELAGLGMIAQTLYDNLTETAHHADDAIASRNCQLALNILEGITRTHQEVQAIARGLVPAWIGTQGLKDALCELAHRTDDLKGITCACKCEGALEMVDSFTATHLYRIAQEAVANALKHGKAEHIFLSLDSKDKGYHLRVANDGISFNAATQSNGVGLKTMIYRASLIGAQLTVASVETGGTLVDCTTNW